MLSSYDGGTKKNPNLKLLNPCCDFVSKRTVLEVEYLLGLFNGNSTPLKITFFINHYITSLLYYTSNYALWFKYSTELYHDIRYYLKKITTGILLNSIYFISWWREYFALK